MVGGGGGGRWLWWVVRGWGGGGGGGRGGIDSFILSPVFFQERKLPLLFFEEEFLEDFSPNLFLEGDRAIPLSIILKSLTS